MPIIDTSPQLFTSNLNTSLVSSSTAITYVSSNQWINEVKNTSNYILISSNQIINNINTKQNILTAETNILGIGSSISALDYAKITLNKPTNFQADWNTTISNKPIIYTQTETNTLLNAKQNTLTASTILSGIGSNLTLINYSNLFNLPSTFPADMTNIYNKTEVNTISNNNINYTTITSNILNTKIDVNNINISNILYNTNYTDERPYPPKEYTSSSSQSTITYLGQTPVYFESINLDTSGITYGSGNYEIYSSENNTTSISLSGIGNNVLDDNNYSYALFTANGTFTTNSNIICDILIVGGGGGGGRFGGGGGAGNVLYTTNFNLSSGTHNIVVGAGGAGSSTEGVNASNGSNSSITISGTSYTATGGGGGGSRSPSSSAFIGKEGNNGGSGGGGSHSDISTLNNVGGTSTKNTYSGWTSLGNSGGDGKDGTAGGYGSGGGGGAGSVGANAGTNSGGNGGSGVNLSSIFGTDVGHSGWFGGGGGGGSWTGTSGQVGFGNGGSGLLGGGGSAYGGNGLANTGGGAGGADYLSTGGTGGTGVVIIRFLKKSNETKKELFNSMINETGSEYGSFNYNSSTGIYLTTDRYIKNDYYGDFLVVKLPLPIFLNRFRIFSRPSFVERAPSLWKLYGSNNNNDWEEITQGSNSILLNIGNYSSGYYEKTVANISKSYIYFGLVVSRIIGGNSNSHTLNFTEFQLFGKEILSLTPAYITSNDFNTSINTKENILTFNSPLTRTTNAIGINLGSYYNKTDTDTLLNTKQATLTFTSPLTNTANTVSIDLSSKENVLTFNSPLTRTTNAIGINLGSYYNKTDTDTLLNTKQATLTFTSPLTNTANTVSIDLSSKENVLTFNSPLTRTTNAIGINLGSYYNKTDTDTLLNTKQATLTFTSPLTNTANTVSIDLSSYSTTGNDANYLLKSGGVMTGDLTISRTGARLSLKGTGTLGAISRLDLSAYDFTTNEPTCSIITTDDGNFSSSFDIRLKTPGALANSQTSALFIKSDRNIGIGTNNPNNILQVGDGARLRISNGISDYSIIGSKDVDDNNNTRIVVSGNSRGSGLSGCIEYLAASGAHIFSTNGTANERMRILNNGNIGIGITNPFASLCIGTPALTSDGILVISKRVAGGGFRNFRLGIDNDFNFCIGDFGNAVSGNTWVSNQFNINYFNGNIGVGILSSATYKLNVNGSINSTSLWQNGTQIDFNSYLLKSGGAMTGQITGVTTLNGTTGIFGTLSTTNNTNVALPSVGVAGGIGDKLILYAGTASVHPFSLGINNSTLWYSVPTGAHHIFYTAGTERMRIKSNGNVGIGTNDPLCQLQVNGIGNINNGSPYATANNFMQSGSLTIGGTNANYGGGNNWTGNTAGLMMECDVNTEIAIHDAGQRVASLMYYANNVITIGRDMAWGAISLVDIKSGLTISGQLTNQFWRLTNQSDWLRVYTASGDNYFNFAANYLFAAQGLTTNNECYFNISGFGTIMQITSSGVRIPSSTFSIAEWYLSQSTSPTNVLKSFVFHHSATGVNSKWWFNGAQTNTSSEISDERIKKEINDIQTPLNKIMELKPKQYYLCDDKDYNKKFGVIAQDVEKVFPELIHTEKDYVANIYSYAKYENGIITLDKDITELINIDDELKIILDNNDKNNLEIVIDDTPYNNRYKRRFVKVVEIIDNHSFKIDIDLEINDIFIYGKKVDDFKRLDYESLYCLNIAGTQELYKLIQLQEERIRILEEKLASF